MTNEDHTQNGPSDDGLPTDRRPLGYWLRTVDALITREFATAFATEGVTRRDWMLLNALSGAVDAPALAEKLARRGKRLRGFAERGWAVETDGRWELTDEGRAAQARLGAIVQDVREKVASAVSPEDFTTLISSLEAIARELGWEENARMPRGRRHGFGGRGRGFAPRFGHDFGPAFGEGFGPAERRFGAFGFDHRFAELGDGERAAWAARAARHGFGPSSGPCRAGHDPHAHAHRGHGARHGHDPRFEAQCDHPHRHGRGGHGKGRGDARPSERAYERGFEAGFRAANPAAAPASGSAA